MLRQNGIHETSKTKFCLKFCLKFKTTAGQTLVILKIFYCMYLHFTLCYANKKYTMGIYTSIQEESARERALCQLTECF